MFKKHDEHLRLERSLLRKMKAGEKLVYFETKDNTRNRVRFDAVRHEYEAGFGYPVQKITGSFKRTDYSRMGIPHERVYNNFEYIYIRSSKV